MMQGDHTKTANLSTTSRMTMLLQEALCPFQTHIKLNTHGPTRLYKTQFINNGSR